MRIVELPMTTNAGGAGTVAVDIAESKGFPSVASGALLYAVEWDANTISGGTAVLSTIGGLNGSAWPVLTLGTAAIVADGWFYPRTFEHNNAGSVLTTYTMPVVIGTLQLVVTGGGSVKSGGAWAYLMDT